MTETEMGEIFNKAELLHRVMDEPKILKKIVGIFVTTCPNMLSDIQKAISDNNAEELAFCAHALKGSVSNFSAPAAFNLAFTLEKMGQNKELSQAKQEYAKLVEEIERLKTALVEFADNI